MLTKDFTVQLYDSSQIDITVYGYLTLIKHKCKGLHIPTSLYNWLVVVMLVAK